MNPNIDPESENLSSAEKEFEKVLRPAEFDDFTGQYEVVENLKIFVATKVICLHMFIWACKFLAQFRHMRASSFS